MRAKNTAMPIRPSGVMKTRKPATIHHQLTVTVHGSRFRGATERLLTSASQTTHCRPFNVANGSDSAT